MTKHTPGPWVADLYEDGCFVVRPHGHEGPIIAERGVWFDDESHSNARLIASAPELLLAAKFAIARDAAEGYGMHPKSIEELMAAIAKAEGGNNG